MLYLGYPYTNHFFLDVLVFALAHNLVHFALELVTGVAGESALAALQLHKVLLGGRIQQFPAKTVIAIQFF